MGHRRKGRELALKLAYQIEMRGTDHDELESMIGENHTTGEKANEFACFLVKGSLEHRSDIDLLIKRYTENWLPDRMAIIDRNILRLACFEMLYMVDIPPKATINEWIEIAKKYSTEYSGAFVNGILDRLNKEKDSMEKDAISDDKTSHSGANR